MQDKDKSRILTLLPGLVMFSIFLILFIAMIPFIVFTVENFDEEFWIGISVIIFLCLLIIWGIIVSAQYADIDYNWIRLRGYNTICDIEMADIELVEIRKSAIGHLNIIVKTKEPIRVFKRNKKRNKFMQEFGFIHSAKLVGIFKHYLPKEIPWIYNDYFKNPNSEPKNPKKK